MSAIPPKSSTAICVLGAGGFGREVFGYLEDIIAKGAQYHVIGFLDDRPDALEGFELPVEIIGSLSTAGFDSSLSYVIALGDANLRARYGTLLRAANCSLFTLIHPTAYVARTACIGSGVIVGPFSVVSAHSHIHDNTVLNLYASVGHDAVVGAHSVLSPYATLNGGAHLGQRVFLGTHATILPRVEVGAASKVSAGTIVTTSVPAGSLVAGHPARYRVVFPEDGQ